MTLADIVQDPATGRLSHTKLWNNVANLVITLIVLHRHLQGKDDLGWVVAYAAIVGSVACASKLLSLRSVAPKWKRLPRT